MEKDTTIRDKKKQRINAIEQTDEHLTSRAGLALFARYLQSIQLMPILEKQTRPAVIELGPDSMVLDKDDAHSHSIIHRFDDQNLISK